MMLREGRLYGSIKCFRFYHIMDTASRVWHLFSVVFFTKLCSCVATNSTLQNEFIRAYISKIKHVLRFQCLVRLLLAGTSL